MVLIIDGKSIANKLLFHIYREFEEYEQYKLKPHLVICNLNENDYSTKAYIRSKLNLAKKLNIQTTVLRFCESELSTEKVYNKIDELNKDESVTSIIIQLPVGSKNIDITKCLNKVDNYKDVDSLGESNMKNTEFSFQDSLYISPAALGIATLVYLYSELTKNNFAVIGEGKTVGKPTYHMLKHFGNNVVSLNSQTKKQEEICIDKNILICASGKRNHVTANYMKMNCGIVDCGSYDVVKKSVSCSVNMADAKSKASWIAPTPGGLGPLTVAWLYHNVFEAHRRMLGFNPNNQINSFMKFVSRVKNVL